MLQKFKKHITANFPFLEGKKLLIAISGGLDSVVLTHLLITLSEVEVSLAHCNFKLRNKESDLDEKFVKNLSKKLSNQIFTKEFNTKEFARKNKLSTQIAARDLRYSWFKELIENHNFDYVLTAHHADDNLETFLINLTRGTGLDGLTGIPAINGKIIRPLLAFSREEISTFAKENNIEWREDQSNSSTKYIRNKIRHEVLPKLKEINPSLLASFEKTSEFLQQSQQIVKDRVEEIKSDILHQDLSTESILSEVERLKVTKFDIEKIQQLSNPKAYLYQFLKEYNFTEWNDVYNLLSAQPGKQLFSKTHRLIKDRVFLLLSKIEDASFIKTKEFLIEENTPKITTPINLKLEQSTHVSSVNKNSIFVDKSLLKFPLKVRKWGKGDYTCLIGMKGRKKISKYFKDEKLSLLEKESIWLLTDVNNTIIWIIGKRQDRRFLAIKTTINILKISYQ